MYELLYERLYDLALLLPWLLLIYLTQLIADTHRGVAAVSAQVEGLLLLSVVLSIVVALTFYVRGSRLEDRSGIRKLRSGLVRKSRTGRRAAAWLLLFSLSAVMALALWPKRSASEIPFTGLPYQRVTMVEGIVVQDARRLASGGERLRLSLNKVSSFEGDEAEAFGKLVMYIDMPGRRTLRRGEVIEGPIELVKKSASGAGGSGESVGGGKAEEAITVGYAAGIFRRIGWRSEMEKLRAKGLEFVHSRIRSVGSPASGLLSALLLGMRGPASEEAFAFFRRAGAVHLLALSGMHLGFLFLVTAAVMLPLFGSRVGLVSTLIVMICYLLFVGPRPSLVRAVLMSGTGIVWRLVSTRKIDTIRILLWSFILQALISPADVYSLSFALSYTALFGILGASAAIERRLPFFIPPKMRGLLSAGIGAQAFSAPLLIHYFGELYPIGVISSLVLSPLVLALMAGGIFYLIWTSFAVHFGGIWYVLADRGFRQLLVRTAEAVESLAVRFARVPSLRFSGEEATRAFSISLLLLTTVVILHYGRRAFRRSRKKSVSGGHGETARSGRRRRNEESGTPRLTGGFAPISRRGRTGSVPPLWAELPRQSAGAEEDNRAA